MASIYDEKMRKLPVEDSGVPQVPYENIVHLDMDEVNKRLDASLGTCKKCSDCRIKCGPKEFALGSKHKYNKPLTEQTKLK